MPATAEEKQEVEKWQGHITAYDRAFSSWQTRVEKIVKRYRDEDAASADKKQARFNILWSNTQVLTAATFARIPKPDVSRRFLDRDQVGRVAATLLQRGLEYEVSHYPDYKATMKASVLDRFLGGRGTAWARYEPNFKPGQPVTQDSGQVTEDTEAPSELDYECAPTDYVHWRDFGHSVARTWEEVTAVWRNVYLTRESCVKRFGEEKGNAIPLDARPDELKESEQKTEAAHRALIVEIWDKSAKEALWLSPTLGEIVDRRKDPLGLEEFFPCPKPLYATLANDKLEPTPDFVQYESQAIALDSLAKREDELIDAIRVIGTYDASVPELQRVFTEAGNTQMVPVTNYAAFAEKGKIAGAVQFTELQPIYEALAQCYIAAENVKSQVYEITRVSDIMRGYVDPREKLGQSELKSQYGNLGIKSYQEEVADYATELIRIKAQIMCNKFSAETLLAISAAEQLSDRDKAFVPEAMKLLLGTRATEPGSAEPTPNPLRSFRIEISTDSLVHIDEEREKESRMQFLQANSAFLKDVLGTMATAGPMAGALVPLMMNLWEFGVRGFKVGWQIEGAFEEAIEQMQAMANQQPQLPPEVMQKIQAMQEELGKTKEENLKLKTGAAEKQAQLQVDAGGKAQQLKQDREHGIAELALKKELQDAQIALDRAKAEADIAIEKMRCDADEALGARKQAADENDKRAKLDFDKQVHEEGKQREDESDEVRQGVGTMKQIQKEVGDVLRALEESDEVSVQTVKDAAGNIVGGVAKYQNGRTRKVTIQ